MLKYIVSIRETDLDYNIPQTTPWRYIIDTKTETLNQNVSRKVMVT